MGEQVDIQTGTMIIPEAIRRQDQGVVTILQPIPTGTIILGLKVAV